MIKKNGRGNRKKKEKGKRLKLNRKNWTMKRKVVVFPIKLVSLGIMLILLSSLSSQGRAQEADRGFAGNATAAD